jgi:hypothetical protein
MYDVTDVGEGRPFMVHEPVRHEDLSCRYIYTHTSSNLISVYINCHIHNIYIYIYIYIYDFEYAVQNAVFQSSIVCIVYSLRRVCTRLIAREHVLYIENTFHRIQYAQSMHKTI